MNIIFLLGLFTVTISKPYDEKTFSKSQHTLNCGYKSCHKTDDKKLNVHIIPHSHDDVGWRKTFDEYYNGRYVEFGVKHIINSVVNSLRGNPNRRFSQVETAYFSRWWDLQNETTKLFVKELVNNGQLEMVNGGWSMNDEAATNYYSIIDQMTLGLQTLNDIFGECGRPRIGWQIDPFGHSNAMAAIFADLGFDAVFFWRLDFRDGNQRQATNKTEFIWRGNLDIGQSSDIFTSLLYQNYDSPKGFCWDIQCGDPIIVDDVSSPHNNVKTRVEEFSKRIYDQANKYKTNNILITMGGDFTYSVADKYYTNIEKLIKGFATQHPEINMIYSTPSCYVKAVNEAAKLNKFTFPLEINDFMPHASEPHTYWTGFYSSRPNSKRFERMGNNILQVIKHLVVFGNAKNKTFDNDIINLKKAMGILQHHDAITGTEKQYVANDYVRILTSAIYEAQNSISEIIFDLLKTDATDTNEYFTMNSCILSNVSRCEHSSHNNFSVAVYNPHSRIVSHFVRIPVVSINYKVTGLDGKTIVHQITPMIDTFNDVPGNSSFYELTFEAKHLPPFGINYFYIVKNDNKVNVPNLIQSTKNTRLGTESTGFEIDQHTGLLTSVKLSGVVQPIKQQFFYYKSNKGVYGELRASGAYIFRPLDNVARIINNTAEYTVYQGQIFDEVHQKFNNWLKQVIRVYKTENFIEFDWIVGPLSYVETYGIEVITRFTTDLKSESTFYTDSNGRQLIKRIRNQRPTFKYTNEEPISGNYYPVTSRIVIKDKEKQLDLAILNDRSQGGSSLEDGEIELMIHRKLTNDDGYGVDEVLNEQEFNKGVVVRGQHYLVLGTKSVSGPVQQVDLSNRLLLSPWTFFGNFLSENYSIHDLTKKINLQFSGLTRELPQNARILTLETLSDTKLLLRLEHPFSKYDDQTLGASVTINIEDILTLYKIKSVKETTLSSIELKKEIGRFQWSIEGEESSNRKSSKIDDFLITLNPMEIRTFVLEVEYRLYKDGINISRVLLVLFVIAIFLFLMKYLFCNSRRKCRGRIWVPSIRPRRYTNFT